MKYCILPCFLCQAPRRQQGIIHLWKGPAHLVGLCTSWKKPSLQVYCDGLQPWDSAPSYQEVIQSPIVRVKTLTWTLFRKKYYGVWVRAIRRCSYQSSPQHTFTVCYAKSCLLLLFISPRSVEKMSQQISVQDSVSKEREDSLH